MDSPHQTTIDSYIDKYILKKEIQQDSYMALLQHACDCYRNINIRHSNKEVTAKVSVSALGIIEMPSDLIGFGFVAVPINGEFWTFSMKRRKVNTTTTTVIYGDLTTDSDLVTTDSTIYSVTDGAYSFFQGTETQDSDMGEGVDVKDDLYLGIGGRGGVNSYYMTIDWKARRIFCDGFKSDIAVIRYASSGLVVGGTTFVPVQCETTMDAYLDWQRAMNKEAALSRIAYLEGVYEKRLLEQRIIDFMPTLDDLKDAWDSSSSIGIMR
jgi:hypothetical protein